MDNSLIEKITDVIVCCETRDGRNAVMRLKVNENSTPVVSNIIATDRPTYYAPLRADKRFSMEFSYDSMVVQIFDEDECLDDNAITVSKEELDALLN